MKVLLAPTNFANQPALLTRALRERSVDARHLLYAWSGRNVFGFDREHVVDVDRSTWLRRQLEVLSEVVDERMDVVHLWHRSLLCPPGGYGVLSGLDLPFLRASGARIVYRFTGYDLRLPSVDRAVNPYSPFDDGFAAPTDESLQRRYLEYLRDWVDAFVVQDPEMRTFLPEADVIPRGVDLDEFAFVGPSRRDRPLVVHAPSLPSLKGTDAVLRAVKELRARGRAFDFKLIKKLSHREAADWYRRADIVVDQLRIGWYGVLAVEAMALGKPVLAYIRPGLEEQLDRPLPVVSATVDDLPARLETLLSDADLRAALGRQGREFAERVHDIRIVAGQAEGLYRRVLAAPEPAAASAPARFVTAGSSEALELMRASRFYEQTNHSGGRHEGNAYTHDRLTAELARLDSAGSADVRQAVPVPSGRGRLMPVLRRVVLASGALRVERRVRRIAGHIRRDPAASTREAQRRLRRMARAAARRRMSADARGTRRTSADPAALRVCILALKSLARNTRVVRQADALARAGHRVTVVSVRRPADELVELTPTVEYLDVRLDTVARRAMRWLASARKVERTAGTAAPATRPTARRSARQLVEAVLAIPSAALLRQPGQALAAEARRFAALSARGLIALYADALMGPVTTRSFAARACGILERRAFDVYQAHGNFALVAAKRLSRRSGAALVYDAVEISEHQYTAGHSPLERAVRRIERWEEARILRSADAMLTIGDGLADWYARRYGIPRPLPVRNCRWFWPYVRSDHIRRDCSLGPEDRLVVWFGYIYPMQGVEALVKAAAMSPANVHYALLAPVLRYWADFLAEVNDEVVKLGLSGRVHFLPPREPNDLIRYVSGADLGIIPRPNATLNIYYSMPNKLLEMVMARLPVAVSDLHDIRRLVERYDIGAVFDVADPASIARTVTGMLDPHEHARLRSNVMAAAEALCWENESRPYVALFAPTGHLVRRRHHALR